MNKPWFEITYTDKWTGKTVVMPKNTDRGDVRSHAEQLARQNNCRATCIENTKDGQKHVVTEGN